MHFQGLLGGARDDARSHKALLLPPIKKKVCSFNFAASTDTKNHALKVIKNCLTKACTQKTLLSIIACAEESVRSRKLAFKKHALN